MWAREHKEEEVERGRARARVPEEDGAAAEKRAVAAGPGGGGEGKGRGVAQGGPWLRAREREGDGDQVEGCGRIGNGRRRGRWGRAMRRWREDEGRDEGRARGARVRSVGLGLGSKWAGLVCWLGWALSHC